MNDYSGFESRFADALSRYADRAPIEVDVTRMVRALATLPSTSSSPRRTASDRVRPRLAAVLVLVAVTLTGVVLFGGRLLAPAPPVVVSPSPSTAPAPATPTPTATSSSPTLASPTPAAVLRWKEADIGTQAEVTSIWRVGEWFIAVGPRGTFTDEGHADARFIRSRNGLTWENVPAPARGLEVEAGTVVEDALWLVGSLGSSADPKRGIWTTNDGLSWRRVADVTGLDFGPGGVVAISHAGAGWLALARRWIDAESADGFMLRSIDGVAWSKEPYPDGAGQYDVAGLVSDGTQWLLATEGYEQGQPASLEALTSSDGLTWTTHVVDVLPKPGAAAAVTFGPSGFVIVGQILDGEYPHAVAWASPDGATWSAATMAGLPDPAGETGLESVVAFDSGYFATGYRLDDTPSFWTSVDGSSWAQVDDLFGSDPVSVQAIAASDAAYLAGGDDRAAGAFIWAAPH